MSLESNFLDIYEVVLEKGFDEFYSSDVSEHMDLASGNVGNTVHRTVEKYELPITIERDRPNEASLFVVEDRLSYSELEDLLDPDPADLVEDSKEAAKEDVMESLDSRQYTEPELLAVLGEAVAKYYNNDPKKHEILGQLKSELIEEDIITGSTINGWTVKK